MLREIGIVVVHVAGTLMLVALVTQLVFLASIILVLAGFESPLVVRSLSNDGYTTVYHGNLQYILPASTAMMLPMSYRIGKKRGSVRSVAREYLIGVMVAVAMVVAVHLAVYLWTCAHNCTELTCGLGSVQECSVRISWTLAEALCRCK